MGWIAGFGVAVTLIGLGLLAWCVIRVVRAKRARLDDDAMKATLKSVVTWNLVAMGLSGLGLMILVVGLIL